MMAFNLSPNIHPPFSPDILEVLQATCSIMKIRTYIVFVISISVPAWSQQQTPDPFAQPNADDVPSNIDEGLHRWNDHIVDLDSKDHAEYLKFGNNAWMRVDKINVTLTFSVGQKEYEQAINHPDFNRGVALIAGNPEKPEIYCWMRPFMINSSQAIFIVTLPRDNMKKFYLAFIPYKGKSRFLYNVADVANFYRKIVNDPTIGN